MAKQRRAPFLGGYSTGIPHADKAQVIEIVGMAAETIRRYAHHQYPRETQAAVNLTIMAGMLEWEVKKWAERVATNDGDSSQIAFQCRQIGRA